jgi:membrane protein implicated in regulation of membrane protease activity
VGAVVPFIVSIRLALYFGYSWQAAFVVFAGVVAMFAVHAFLVPLVPRGT